jgi:dihydroorotate dehydrogenase (fumarate)
MDLSTKYLGLQLKSPIVASPSPLWRDLDNVKWAADAGAGAVILHSLFEEQIDRESDELNEYLSQGTESFAESLSYFPEMEDYGIGPEDYLDHISRAKDAVDVPIIGSLNGVSAGGWVEYARRIQEAGADALELNVYYIPTRPGMSPVEVDDVYVELAVSVKSNLDIPVAVKIAPYFSSLPNLASRLDGARIDGLVLFNRFYQPDLDIEERRAVPNLVPSTPQELRLRLRWVAILYGRIEADMAVTGGVHSAEDAVKSIMAGARAAMMTSAVHKNGIGHLTRVRDGVADWMKSHEYGSVDEMVGILSQRSVPDPAAFERANYLKIVSSHD